MNDPITRQDPRLQGLYVITDAVLTPAPRLLQSVEAALLGGARIVQYRDKSHDKARRFDEASRLRDLCHAHDAIFIVNDDATLAQAVSADGVHLGLEDGDIAAARALLGDRRIIGATCHGDPQLAQQAIAAGTDYVAFGRFFASGTKPGALPARLEEIAPALPLLPRPAVAIGGITLEQAEPLIGAGFAMLAVIGDVFAREGEAITRRCQDYARLFRKHSPASRQTG